MTPKKEYVYEISEVTIQYLEKLGEIHKKMVTEGVSKDKKREFKKFLEEIEIIFDTVMEFQEKNIIKIQRPEIELIINKSTQTSKQ